MKRIIFTLVFVISASAIFAQYTMSIKKVDNSTQEVWIHDIAQITFTEVAFTCGTNTISYGGQTYNTVQIGTQCWLKENLNVGTRIDGTTGQTNNTPTNIIEKYCYDNLESNCTTYGALYQWNEAMQYITTEKAKGICPIGWHIPTRAEFQACSTAVGGDGNALKAVGQGTAPGAGTNTSGFSALLAGFSISGGFYHLDETDFWSSTEYNTNDAYYLRLYNNNNSIDITFGGKLYGFSVRCLKD